MSANKTPGAFAIDEEASRGLVTQSMKGAGRVQPASGGEFPVHEARRVLSPERLAAYERAVPSGEISDALALYFWNVGAGQAYEADLHLIEIALRNALSDELTQVYGRSWYLTPGLLDERSCRALSQSWARIEHAYKATPSAVPPGAVVASLSFGFWVDLLDAGSHVGKPPFRQRCDYERTLWRPALHKAFSAPEYGLRKPTHRDVDRLRRFRNRIAHHEPLFDGLRDPYSAARLSLDDVLDLISRVLGALSRDAEQWRRRRSEVPAALLAQPRILPRAKRLV